MLLGALKGGGVAGGRFAHHVHACMTPTTGFILRELCVSLLEMERMRSCASSRGLGGFDEAEVVFEVPYCIKLAWAGCSMR